MVVSPSRPVPLKGMIALAAITSVALGALTLVQIALLAVCATVATVSMGISGFAVMDVLPPGSPLILLTGSLGLGAGLAALLTSRPRRVAGLGCLLSGTPLAGVVLILAFGA